MFTKKIANSLLSAIFIEIVLFWALVIAGKGIDKLMNDVYPDTSNKLQSVLVLNIQIVLITLLGVLGRPFIIEKLGGAPKLQGMGMLYGFALLLNQTNFKKRAASIV